MARRGFDDPQVAAEAGRKGAETVLKRHGREHYASLGRVGGSTNRDRHGPDHFRELGRLGSQVRWQRYRERKAHQAPAVPEVRNEPESVREDSSPSGPLSGESPARIA